MIRCTRSNTKKQKKHSNKGGTIEKEYKTCQYKKVFCAKKGIYENKLVKYFPKNRFLVISFGGQRFVTSKRASKILVDGKWEPHIVIHLNNKQWRVSGKDAFFLVSRYFIIMPTRLNLYIATKILDTKPNKWRMVIENDEPPNVLLKVCYWNGVTKFVFITGKTFPRYIATYRFADEDELQNSFQVDYY